MPGDRSDTTGIFSSRAINSEDQLRERCEQTRLREASDSYKSSSGFAGILQYHVKRLLTCVQLNTVSPSTGVRFSVLLLEEV